MRYDFASDNTAGMAPEALDALVRANSGAMVSYGADEISTRAADLIRERLQADAEVRFLFSGTAANALALSMVADRFESVLAHEHAHVCTVEAGAPGFFGQGLGLTRLSGPSGRIDEASLDAALAEPEAGYLQPPAALSLTQVTEYGAAYSTDALRRLIEPCKLRGLKVQMDGARLANAAAGGFDLGEIARLGVDVLVMGAAKAGAGCVEALVVFDKTLTRRLDNRLKQAGQTASKSRVLVAPFLGLLESQAWEGHAAHANLMARRLADGIAARTPFALAHPVEANLVFLRMAHDAHARLLASGWSAHDFSDGSIRFVCSWATTPETVDECVEALVRIA